MHSSTSSCTVLTVVMHQRIQITTPPPPSPVSKFSQEANAKPDRQYWRLYYFKPVFQRKKIGKVLACKENRPRSVNRQCVVYKYLMPDMYTNLLEGHQFLFWMLFCFSSFNLRNTNFCSGTVRVRFSQQFSYIYRSFVLCKLHEFK